MRFDPDPLRIPLIAHPFMEMGRIFDSDRLKLD